MIPTTVDPASTANILSAGSKRLWIEEFEAQSTGSQDTYAFQVGELPVKFHLSLQVQLKLENAKMRLLCSASIFIHIFVLLKD